MLFFSSVRSIRNVKIGFLQVYGELKAYASPAMGAEIKTGEAIRQQSPRGALRLRLGVACISSQALRPSDALREKARGGAIWVLVFGIKPQRKTDDGAAL